MGHLKRAIDGIRSTRYEVTSREWLIFGESSLWLTPFGEWNVRPKGTLYKKSWSRADPYQRLQRVVVRDREVPGTAIKLEPKNARLEGEALLLRLPGPDSYAQDTLITIVPDGELHYWSAARNMAFSDAVAVAIGGLAAKQ